MSVCNPLFCAFSIYDDKQYQHINNSQSDMALGRNAGGSDSQISPSCGGWGPRLNTMLLGTIQVSLTNGSHSIQQL